MTPKELNENNLESTVGGDGIVQSESIGEKHRNVVEKRIAAGTITCSNCGATGPNGMEYIRISDHGYRYGTDLKCRQCNKEAHYTFTELGID